MDQIALVENQIEDGKKLIERLVRQGIAVTAAGWVKTTEDSQWYLYIATPIVDEQGIAQAYRQVYPLIRQMQQGPFWLDPFEVKLIEPTDPIATAILQIQRRYPGKFPTRYRGDQLGGVSIEGAYIYPPITADR